MASLFVAFAATGCERSCKNDHPYVPYAVGDAPSSATPDVDADVPPAEEKIDASVSEPSLVAPASATTWNLDGRSLVAPDGTEFAYAIVRDFDGDGAVDVLALVRSVAGPTAESVSKISVIHYAGARPDGLPVTVLDPPPVNVEPSCRPLVGLTRIGAHSAAVDVGTSCTAREASRTLYVVRLAKEPSVAFDVRVRDPESAAKLTVDVDGSDRDRDGIDDVTLRVTVEESAPPFEPAPRVSANLTFFDRPAGASRSPDEPEASFRAIAARATSRAGKAKEAPNVPALVRQLRVLHRAICAESGAPRLTKRGSDRGAVACGASKALEDANVAEVRAYVTQKDALRALWAARRAQSFPATTTKAKTAELSSMLDGLAPVVQAKGVRVLDVPVTAAKGPHPSWGALAFEPSGRLLVRSDVSVLRVDPSSDEREDTEIAPWPLLVVSPDGKSRWLEVYHACGGASLRATFVPTGGEGDVLDVALPILAPFAPRCDGRRGEPLRVLPLSWGARGLEAIVEGQPVLVERFGDPAGARATLLPALLDERTIALGAPRSPNGKGLAVPLVDAVFVRSDRGPARYRGAGLEPYASLRSCVVSDDGASLACEKDGKVLVASF